MGGRGAYARRRVFSDYGRRQPVFRRAPVVSKPGGGGGTAVTESVKQVGDGTTIQVSDFVRSKHERHVW